MNFDTACEMAEQEGIKTKIIVADDIASANHKEKENMGIVE